MKRLRLIAGKLCPSRSQKHEPGFKKYSREVDISLRIAHVMLIVSMISGAVLRDVDDHGSMASIILTLPTVTASEKVVETVNVVVPPASA